MWLLKKALPSREKPDISLSIMNSKARLHRVLHNSFHLRGAMSLDEVENMAALQPFTVGGFGGMLPQENFGKFLRSIMVHSEAYREAHRAS